MNTDNIHDSNDWTVLFNLLECAGAGAKPPPMVNSNPSDVVSDTGMMCVLNRITRIDCSIF